jgi:hypothetical protein
MGNTIVELSPVLVAQRLGDEDRVLLPVQDANLRDVVGGQPVV